METLCFKGDYTRRFARSREFMHRCVEDELDRRFSAFCNQMLQEEFILQSGALSYERTPSRRDRRNGLHLAVRPAR